VVAETVRRLAELVNRPGPPALSGELTTIRSEATVPGTPGRVWNLAAMPWSWLANGGVPSPARFTFDLYEEPKLEVCGGLTSVTRMRPVGTPSKPPCPATGPGSQPG
jgi:hypothetical protein